MRFNIAKTFGIQCDPNLEVDGGDNPNHPAIPELDPDYIIRKEVLRDILYWHSMRRSGETDDFLYLSGHTATGKTSIIRQIAARLKIPVFEINGHSRLEFPELVGTVTLIESNTIHVDGPLTSAYREGGWFLLNEQNLLDPGTSAGLNDIGKVLAIPATGEQLVPHPNFGVIFSGNAVQGGEHAALYAGTMRNNIALLGRCYMVEVGYPSPEDEVMILRKAVPSLTKEIAELFVGIANDIRGMFAPEDPNQAPTSDVTCCTRTLLRWAHAASFFKANPGADPIHYAFDRALGYRTDPVTRTAFHELIDRKIGTAKV